MHIMYSSSVTLVCNVIVSGTSPLQVELGANLFVYISLVTCECLQLFVVFSMSLRAVVGGEHYIFGS